MQKSTLLTLGFALLACLGASATCGMQENEFSPWVANGLSVRSLTFSPDDRRFAAIAMATGEEINMRLIVVDRSSGDTLLRVDGIQFLNPCFDSTGRYLAAFVDHNLSVFDVENGRTLFSVNRGEVFDGHTAAMGFSKDGTRLVLDSFGGFGFRQQPPERMAIAVPSGEVVEATAEPGHWYGEGLTSDGTKWFRGGMHGPTPRVFRRNGEYIGYCMRWPNIRNAWFSRDGESLVSLHEDGILIRWDLSDVGDDHACTPSLEEKTDSLLQCQAICPLNTEDAFAVVDRQGRLVRRSYPDWRVPDQAAATEQAGEAEASDNSSALGH